MQHFGMASSFRILFVAAFACLSTACVTGDDEDAGTPTPDAGDAGPPAYAGPPYEVDPGFFPEGGLAEDPARCGLGEYRWWGTSALGDLLTTQRKHDFSIELLDGFKGLLDNQELAVITREPQTPSTLFRVRYQTQDRGYLTDATAMIAYPEISGPAPVVLFMHGTAGFSDGCSPSAEIDGFLSTNYINAATIGLFASFGYIVVAPDYLGMKSITRSDNLHPYLVAEPTALVAIDAVRAAMKLVADEKPDLIVGDLFTYGQSQGGHGAAFVGRYLPHYAPEMSLLASVFVVPPLDLVGESLAALGSESPTNIGNAAVSTAATFQWYAHEGELGEALRAPRDTETLATMESSCTVPEFNGPVTETFTSEIIGGDAQPWQCYQLENSLLHTSVPVVGTPAPALVITGENDALVDSPTEEAAVLTLCAEGQSVHHKACAGGSHVRSIFWSIDDAFNYFEAIQNETAYENGPCAIQAPSACASEPGQ